MSNFWGFNQYDDVGSAWRKVEAERARQAELLAAPAPPTRPLTAEELKELNAKYNEAHAGFTENFLGFLKLLVIVPVAIAAVLFAAWIYGLFAPLDARPRPRLGTDCT